MDNWSNGPKRDRRLMLPPEPIKKKRYLRKFVKSAFSEISDSLSGEGYSGYYASQDQINRRLDTLEWYLLLSKK